MDLDPVVYGYLYVFKEVILNCSKVDMTVRSGSRLLVCGGIPVCSQCYTQLA